MARKCAICGKGPQYGHNVSHSKRRTNRRFLPNLQTGRVVIDGRTVCLRTHTGS
jgi:large subunit ribosomal protein L28